MCCSLFGSSKRRIRDAADHIVFQAKIGLLREAPFGLFEFSFEEVGGITVFSSTTLRPPELDAEPVESFGPSLRRSKLR